MKSIITGFIFLSLLVFVLMTKKEERLATAVASNKPVLSLEMSALEKEKNSFSDKKSSKGITSKDDFQENLSTREELIEAPDISLVRLFAKVVTRSVDDPFAEKQASIITESIDDPFTGEVVDTKWIDEPHPNNNFATLSIIYLSSQSPLLDTPEFNEKQGNVNNIRKQ